MSVVTDITAIEAYVKALFPTATTGKQVVPLQPPDNSFYVRMIGEDRVTETRYHYRVNRTYQVVHITTRPDTALTNMDSLGAALYQREKIGSIRIKAYSVSPPALTDSGQYAIIGVIETEVREARTLADDPLIQHVEVTQN